MRRLSAVLIVLLAAVVPAKGEVRTIDVEGLKITIDSDWGLRTAPGYLPVRFDITNTGEARVIEIVGFGTRYMRGPRGAQPGGITLRQPVRLARGDRIKLTIDTPVFADNENIRFEIQEEGRTLERFNYIGFQSRIPSANASALIVADPATEFGKAAPGWVRRVAAPAGRTSPPLDFVLDPTRLPHTWLGYTSLRAVFLGPHEWQQLTEDQKTALLTWTAGGGDLILLDGSLDALLPGMNAAAGGTSPPAVRAYFLGRIHLLTSAAASSAGLASVLSTAGQKQDSNWALPANTSRDWATITARGFRLPIPGVASVPARTYLMILLVFSAVVGPLNYWFLKRKGQQVLLVLTAPLISVVFILLLGGYVLAGEGIGVRVRAVTFTMLDQAKRQAVTRGSVSLYAAGMSPRGGLRFSRDTAVLPLGRDGNGGRDPFLLDLSDGQRFSAGLLPARSPANFEQVVVRPARERLSITRDTRGVSVVNGLGSRVVTLLYRDGDTIYSLTEPMPAGATALLVPKRLEAATFVPTDLPLSARLLYLVEHQPAGSYLAVLDRSPFWEPGVAAITERESFHIVFGWPEGQP